MLAGNAIAVLQKLGLVDDLHAIAAPLCYGHLNSWRGNVLMDVPMLSTMQQFRASAVAVHRAELMAALVRALEQDRLNTNMQGIAFDQDEDGVRLRFASGEEVQGDLLVGADGLHSIVRSQLFGATRPRYAPWGRSAPDVAQSGARCVPGHRRCLSTSR
jgi:2-polyprenyl-6-methoxyphenol hydroxylase-like FAD-dependent oxidoreductase